MRALAPAVAIVAVVLLAFVGCPGSRGGGEPDVGTLLERVVAAGAPGAFVVVREGGKTRSEARGVADGLVPTPMRSDERFRVGSVTKTFVAALVLRLVQDGRLALDDPVERWLPGLLPAGKEITVRHLLSHTAGLFDYVEDERVLRDTVHRWSPTELIALATAHPPERRQPGRSFAYSSTNYIVLGMIAEKAGGASLERQLRERLFRPLGLRRTSFVPGVISGRHIHGHRPPSHNGIVTGPPADTSNEPAWWTWAAGGIVSTADDVQRFLPRSCAGTDRPDATGRDGETGAGRLEPLRPRDRHVPDSLRAGVVTREAQGTITVAWNTRDAARQVVLVVNTYPLSAELESAVRRAQHAAFCAAR